MSIYDGDGFTFEPYNFPGNVNGANSAFQAGKYAQRSQFFTLGEMSNLRIGLRNDVCCINDWTCFDNFKLWYVAQTMAEAEEVAAVSAVRTGAEGNGAIYTIGGMRVNDASKPGLYIIDGKKVLVK